MGLIGEKLWSVLGLGIGGLSLLLHVIAFALPEWTKLVVKVGKVVVASQKQGLWQYCTAVPDLGCATRSLKKLPDAFRCVQAFACIALVLLLVAVVVSILNVMKSENNKMFPTVLIGVHGAACICLMIAFSVWSAKYVGGGNPGASFGLEIVCFILELVAAVFMFLDFRGRSE